ncbi:MAG: YdeI/OmpD-associated family protein, partial [Candidatus Aminicenantales bacterium]
RKKLWPWWVESAKRPETRTRRLAAVIEGVAEGRSPGM